MLGTKDYVPILKWKRAEQCALETLEDKYKDRVFPLIELVMPKPKSLFKDEEGKIKKNQEELFQELVATFRTKRIFDIPDEIIKYWGTRPAFIDFSLLYTIALNALKTESIKEILEKAAEHGANLIPVLNLSDGEEIKKEIRKTIKKYNNGICLRILPSDLEDINELNNELDHILQYFDTNRDSIDLLVDIKEIIEDNKYYLKYYNLSQGIKNLDKWRSFIFACGSFPENLLECRIDEPKLIPRIEWRTWLDIRNKKAKRIPTFADYSVRSPIYNEELQFYHSTSSIKYTLEKDWLILKGQVKKPEIYLASAVELVKNKIFYGEGFSSGDKYIIEKAKHFEVYIRNPELKGTGTVGTWLKAFINHHLTVTVCQIANLP